MFRSTPNFGRRPSARYDRDRARRPRSFRASLEAVENRTLLSTLSAISWGGTSVLHDVASALVAGPTAGAVHGAISTIGIGSTAGSTQSAVFAIGTDGAVYMNKDATGFVSLGGDVQQISAGFDSAGNPEVYAIGSDDAVWVNHLNGAGWTSLGGDVTAISATADNTVYAIGSDGAVWVNSGSGWTDLGGNLFNSIGLINSISAGLTASGSPEVYATWAHSVLANSGSGWTDLGGDVLAISATADTTFYAIGSDDAVWVNSGSGWASLGGYAKAISAGTTATGSPEVYAIGGGNAAYVNTGNGWTDLGGYVTEIAGTTHSAVYARGEVVSSIYASSSGSGFASVGSTPLAEPNADESYYPAVSGLTLYNGSTPRYLDVKQGSIADCWLLASLAEVADRDPQIIENMFTDDGTAVVNGSTVGVYTVQFYSMNGTRFGIQVDTEFPTTGYADWVVSDMGTSSLWVALAEKAYAEANGLGLVQTNHVGLNSYDSMNFGDPAWALHAITGNSATDNSINTGNIASAWNSGQFIVLCDSTPSSHYIVASHCYAVVGYNASSSQPFELFNPWGTNSAGWADFPGQTGGAWGLFTANAAFISQNFNQQSIDTGASDGDIVDRAVEELTELAAFGNLNGPSGLIRPFRHADPAGTVGALTSLGRSASPRSV
jgi:Calpain family cysteine protease/Tectonin domain